jgi:lysyl-tRNA synthetase class 2
MPSSVIFDRHYDPDTSRLTVTFVTGRIYVYEGVPSAVAADFDAAASKGTYFNAQIRDNYRCHEITPTRE